MLTRKQRRLQTKKKDREFQSDGRPRSASSQETTYIVCPACGRTVELSNSSKHHIIKRRNMATRHDDRFSIRLCNSNPDQEGCHEKVERLGNRPFALQHAVNLTLKEPVKYVLLTEN